MARNILIVDSSSSMRRIIKTMIRATVNDAVVGEASDSREAIDLFTTCHYHIALFSKESVGQEWLDFAKKKSSEPGAKRSNFVFFSSNEEKDYLEELKQYDIVESVIIPCSADELAERLTRICNPFVMRASRRYSAPNTVVHISQGAANLSAEVINFSAGGMLCELDAPHGYNWAAPAISNLEFDLDGYQLTSSGLHTVLSSLTVVDSDADNSPRRVRLACRFVDISEGAKADLGLVFAKIDALEEALRL